MGTPTEELEQRRSMLQEELARIGDLRLGSLIYRYRRCGKPSCLCSDPGIRVTAAGSSRRRCREDSDEHRAAR